ncbi:unnamed protein product [Prorocentrum cordatum]|uniref:tRNA:m(4)X modification enzyme TRM13 n=1 Tax=Prorocentrum cordatum TaxID=2364126 RepID=A0ABN9SSF6_9DINO|nr:unnamed protein product [Polarella glacialis]
MTHAAVPPPPPVPEAADTAAPENGRCAFFLAGKGRRCRCRVEPGLAFCGAHRIADSSDRRVPCPLDPGHTVWERKLQQHLRVCSKAVQDSFVTHQPFYRRGANAGDGGGVGVVAAEAAVAAPAPGESEPCTGQGWAERLASAFRGAVLEVLGPQASPDELLDWSVLAEAGGVAHAEKHEAQNLALAEAACRGGLHGDAVVVEYGCGRAGLAAAVLALRPGRRSVLVDREPRRHKIENRQGTREERILRLRLDVADFDLGALLGPPLQSASLPTARDFDGVPVASGGGADGTVLAPAASGPGGGPAERLEEQWRAAAELQSSPWPPPQVLACAKHLCGGGTDVALRSLLRALPRDGSARGTGADLSVCMATCCHHRCDAASYVNVPFVRRLGLCGTVGEFAQLASAAGWAVGGSGAQQVDGVAKRRLGMMAKRILDLGRVAWLREELGLADASLTCYVDKRVTPENVAILAGGADCAAKAAR